MRSSLVRAPAILGALVVAACSTSSTPDLPAAEPVVSAPIAQQLPMGPLTAAQIGQTLNDRIFRYSGGGRSGTISYYSDGTFSYEEAKKGSGTGLWQASDGKLCEARNPTSFLPKGTPSICTPISSDGTKLIYGRTELRPG
jgi:hypothetical protein